MFLNETAMEHGKIFFWCWWQPVFSNNARYNTIRAVFAFNQNVYDWPQSCK